MINSKITKSTGPVQPSNEEKIIKLLENIDWKLWEMYNIMKVNNTPAAKKTTKKV